MNQQRATLATSLSRLTKAQLRHSQSGPDASRVGDGFSTWSFPASATLAWRPCGRLHMVLRPYGFTFIIPAVSWTVLFHDEFDSEFQTLAKGLQDELLAHALLLSQFGPRSGAPRWTR